MTIPPTITAASRMAAWICTGIRSTKRLAKKAPGSAAAPIKSAKAISWALTTPAYPNTEILITLVTTETTASVAMTAAPSRPEAISSDNRITPEPEVPPTTTP